MASTITRFKYNRKYLAVYMTRELQKSAGDIATKNDLLRQIQSVWRNIELEHRIGKRYQSAPDRLDNVIKMKGHLIKY